MLAQTPPMGWNSWNTFGWKDLHADVVRETIDAFVDNGLKDAGYEYVVIDDTWEGEERVNGRLTWDRMRFPDGILPLARYAHSKGLKFGIYSCAGTHTCAGKLASYGYEEIDAQTFAEWEVDFLKYDACFIPGGTHVPTLYKRMGQALRATGREILYSICEWGNQKPWEWGKQAGGHMWRTTGDINDSWASIVDIGFQQQAAIQAYAGPGGWNDPDMLVVGMHGKGNVAAGGCTDAEYRSHFGLWCLLAAPLMMGCDVRAMSDLSSELLLNKRLIAVNQDALGRPGYRVGQVYYGNETFDIWAKPLAGGSTAVGLFNLGEKAARKIPVGWETLGLHDRRACRVEDLWTGEDLGVWTRSFYADVAPHDCAIVKLTPEKHPD
jgi:alpha-galactosidase